VAKPKVLVADDILEIRQMLRAILQPNYDVVLARNGEEAWELFNSEKPDLVLTDVVMPRMKGDELCMRIKTGSFAPETPVVLITAATRDKELADGFWNKAAGTDAFVSKPFSPNDVLAIVDRLLAAKQQRESAAGDVEG
jgi:CheY-like chemotaxis protein